MGRDKSSIPFGGTLTRRELLRTLLVAGLQMRGVAASSGCSPRPAPTPTIELSHQQAPREARCYRKLARKLVQCQLCFRRCIIPQAKRGFCRARENRGGKLYSLVYGKPCAIVIDPIELEPVYHMLPGHQNFALATASCNFKCAFCHNWHISQRTVEETQNQDLSPEEIVAMREAEEYRFTSHAMREGTSSAKGCQSISFTMNEPTVFYEYMYDIAKLAKEASLRTLFHTNGSLAAEPLFELLKVMDAVTVDLKGFAPRFYKYACSSELEPVLATLKNIRKTDTHLEVVNLVIPTLNDDLDDIRGMCLWVKDNLGEETPLHFNRFFPRYKMKKLPPTPIETLERAKGIAAEMGLHYVYIGNAPGHRYNSTYCPGCGKLLIEREHFRVLRSDVFGGKCRFCGHLVPGIWV